jgi:Glycosyl hydrolase family 26
MNFKSKLALLLLMFCCVCATKMQFPSNKNLQTVQAKFEPADGQCLFFIGQDLAATGGLAGYTDGYADHFEVPAGITTYTSFSPGSESFGYYQKGNDGIKSVANWGAGDNCAQCYLDNKDYKHSIIAIGLSIVGNEKEIASGSRNSLIQELAEWIKESKRPVFLRIGYEFDGWDWNHYERKHYISAWKQIHKTFKEMNVNNVAFVWQSKGNGSGQDVLEKWYPGDDLVDWCGYSYFNNPDQEMLTFARKHKKPVFIAEATPVLHNEIEFTNSKLTDPLIAEKVWREWFIPFIATLNENKDVIKAFSYINANWLQQPMWATNPVFRNADSRIQKSEFVSTKWKEEMANPRYLKASADLWKRIGYEKEQQSFAKAE